MKDLYKRLNLNFAAPEDAIRQSLATADQSVGVPAELILLDARRRAVYDRNHHLLMTIGKLRAQLGLSLAPFWHRADFSDFSFNLGTQEFQHTADPLEVLRAFDLRGARRRRHVRWGTGAAVIAVALLVVAAGLLYYFRK